MSVRALNDPNILSILKRKTDIDGVDVNAYFCGPSASSSGVKCMLPV